MPVTITYDLETTDTNHRTYIRSMLERFHWRRLGGSVFRYEGVQQGGGAAAEDWLNHVVPALMFMRSYALHHHVTFRFFTIDAQSIAHLDHSDSNLLLGNQPQDGNQIQLATPTNQQSAVATIQGFIDAATNAT